MKLKNITGILFFISTALCASSETINYNFQLSEAEKEWLGRNIFENECDSNFECLTTWNKGEEFPSLGIGHFIWYHSEQESPFEETFPQLIEFMRANDAPGPAWLFEQIGLDSPWRSRINFYASFYDPNMTELREFLAQHKKLQVEFIIARFNQTLGQIVLDFPDSEKSAVEDLIQTIGSDFNPHGLYALIDYVHFKGTGLNPSERYDGHGWGLRQVINNMLEKQASLQNFVKSAEYILERRVNHAPLERSEQQWLAGWHKRLGTYLPTN